MSKLPVLDAKEAHTLLLGAGFSLRRIKGSHYIYFKDKTRIIIPFHSGKSLHPKIVKEVLEAITIKEL